MDNRERRPLAIIEQVSNEFGRVADNVTCPFCLTVVLCYRWSRYGGGKRCPGCRALLCSFDAEAPPHGA